MARLHQSFVEISAGLGASLPQGWSRTAACDREMDTILPHIRDNNNQEDRVVALMTYLGNKRLLLNRAARSASAGAVAREAGHQYNFVTPLNRLTAASLPRIGNLSRDLQAVISNALADATPKQSVVSTWMNNIAADYGDIVGASPIVADVAYYRVNGGEYVAVEGDIEVEVGDRLRVYTSGIGFGSITWSTGTNPDDETLDIVVEAGNAGALSVTYTLDIRDTVYPVGTIVVV